ncbi:MAG: exosortase/archaeosortase family protein [Candidatus Bathyarchaeia archaeon]
MKVKLNLSLHKVFQIFVKFLPVVSFLPPILVLHSLYSNSFYGTWEGYWQGRFFYFFFLWICFLETIIGYERLSLSQVNKKRMFILVTFISLPTVYVIIANFFGLNEAIRALAERNGVFHARLLPLSMEYLVFSIFLCLIVISTYGITRLEEFSISIIFLGITGLIYITDQLYPVGRFTPFQSLVFPTANFAQGVLNTLGYPTRLITIYNASYGYYPILIVLDPACPSKVLASFGIAWPCAGVESLIIYTLTITLFLKKSAILRWQKIIYFVVGAVITYLINILRVVLIYLIAANRGNWMIFHNFYGPIMSITWIIFYPVIIIGSMVLWNKIKR